MIDLNDKLLQLINGFINQMRSHRGDQSKINQTIIDCINFIKNDDDLNIQLNKFIKETLGKSHFFYFFKQYSYLNETTIWRGIIKRLRWKLFNEMYEPQDFLFLLSNFLKAKKDTIWVEKLNEITLSQLFNVIHFSSVKQKVCGDLGMAIVALSNRIAAFAMDQPIKVIFDRLKINYDVFYDLQHHAAMVAKTGEGLPQFMVLVQQIKTRLKDLRLRKHEVGTTLKLTYESKRVLAHIDRLQLLLVLYDDINNPIIWKKILLQNLTYQKQKKSISHLINSHIDLVALEIVNHSASTGENYIAQSKNEYRSFFKKSMLAGAVIAVFAWLKIYLGTYSLGNFGSALIFGINYAACFVLVKSMGGLIATKQPAMTASTLVKEIDQNNDLKIDKTSAINLMFKKVFKSQFISFVGNVAIAVPIAIVIGIITNALGNNILKPDKAIYLAKTLEPFSNYTLLYAAIAGVFLSFSGLVSGFIDNKVKAGNLVVLLSAKWRKSKWINQSIRRKIIKFINDKLGAFAGNVTLGLLLGLAGYFGYLLSLPFDIRHIAFSSSNFGFLLSSHHYSMDVQIALWLFLGVTLIGLVNFLVSFGLTLFICFKSRGVSLFNLFGLLTKSQESK